MTSSFQRSHRWHGGGHCSTQLSVFHGKDFGKYNKDSTGTLKEVWDDQKILLETDASNVTQVIYTLSPGVYGDLVSQRRSGVSRYFVFDPLGSTSRLTDGSQNVTDSYLFKGFGESLLLPGPTTNPFQFLAIVGYYVDPDFSSYFARARELSSALARWSSTDPRGIRIDNVNPYVFVANNPVVETDPSGQALFVGRRLRWHRRCRRRRQCIVQPPQPAPSTPIWQGYTMLLPTTPSIVGGARQDTCTGKTPAVLQLVIDPIG